jgi:DNA/RNA-binding domain of Phe-tRNA-synthetase-like protein
VDPEVSWARVAPELEQEFPQLGLAWTVVDARPGQSTPGLRHRLREMSNRHTGARAINLRREPIPWAFRVFYRQVGIDPDDRPTHIEAISLERMRAGEFTSRNLLDDALLIATFDTGVPVTAFDADSVREPLTLRLAQSGERLTERRPLSRGQLLIADSERALGVLFEDMAEGVGVTSTTTRMLFCAPRVANVPEVSVQEALWSASDLVSLA